MARRQRKFTPRPAAAPPGAIPDSATARRDRELAECREKMQAMLTEYAAGFQVAQQMVLDSEGRPRFSYVVNIVAA